MAMAGTAGLPARASRARQGAAHTVLLEEDAADPNRDTNRALGRQAHGWRWLVRSAGLFSAAMIPLAPGYNAGATLALSRWAGNTVSQFHLYVLSADYAMASFEGAFALVLLLYVALTNYRWDEERERVQHHGTEAAGGSLLELIQMLRNADYIAQLATVFGMFTAFAAFARLGDTGFAARPAMAEFLLALVVLRLGFAISRRYMPGSIIVQHFMILGEMAPGISYGAAADLTRDKTWRLAARWPHCFYFRARQKSRRHVVD